MSSPTGSCGCNANVHCIDKPAVKTETACNPCANAASGIIVCNNGVQEVIDPPPNTGGPWVLVWRNDTTPPGWDWQNAPAENPGGGFFSRTFRALFRKKSP